MPLLSEHRRNRDELVRIAQNDLRLILAPYTDAIGARDALLVALPRLVAIYGAAAATLAADWYDDLRDTSPARGRFAAIASDLPDVEATDALVRWSVDPLFSANPDKDQAFARVAGGLQQFVADAGRNTVTVSSIEDPAATGWRRVTSGACPYCASLATGQVMVTKSSVDFQSHKNCGCLAVPAWD